MTNAEIQKAAQNIRKEKDICLKHLKMASLLTRFFKKEGFAAIVVGGSAIEFLTEGAYTSGDLDLCWFGNKKPSLRLCQRIMGKLGGRGGPRNWEVCGMFVDILGMVETEAKTPFRKIRAPYADVFVSKPEDLIVERVLVSCYPQENQEARQAAKKLISCAAAGNVDISWKEAERVAALPSFQVKKDLKKLRQEVTREIQKKTS